MAAGEDISVCSYGVLEPQEEWAMTKSPSRLLLIIPGVLAVLSSKIKSPFFLLIRNFRDIAMVERLPLMLSTMALLLWAATTTQAAEFGTAEEAKAMLDKAVAAVKE